jgi:hypothetical protein
VLQAISRTPGDLAPVFATMLEKATRICQAEFAALYRLEGDGLRLDATYNVPPTFAEAEGMVFRPAPGGALDEVLNTGRTAHVSDLAATRSLSSAILGRSRPWRSPAFGPRSACRWSRTTT